MRVLNKWSEVPAFLDDQTEADFWKETSLDLRLMNASVLKTDNRDSVTITLRFDPRLLARIKRLARTRFLNYQSMIKQWLAERLERELKDLE